MNFGNALAELIKKMTLTQVSFSILAAAVLYLAYYMYTREISRLDNTIVEIKIEMQDMKKEYKLCRDNLFTVASSYNICESRSDLYKIERLDLVSKKPKDTENEGYYPY